MIESRVNGQPRFLLAAAFFPQVIERDRAPPGRLQLRGGWYNTRRLNGSLPYLSSAQWEAAHRSVLTQAA
jgi:hypothetical protein